MLDKVIYFPYIRVPENEWFTRVLLYWDEVGSIVPSEYIDRPERLGNYMSELMQVGLVKSISPGRYIHNIPKFEKAFLDLIDRNETIRQRMNIPFDNRENIRIHHEKFTPLAYSLEDKQLARQTQLNSPWWEFERLTGDLFMAYLASVLGKCEDLQMDPITDDANSLSMFTTTPQTPFDPISMIDQLRMSVLEGILPTPAGGIPVRELSKFKDEHSDLLKHFRREIESSLIEIVREPDLNLRNRRLYLFQDELKEELNDIQKRMHERNWPQIICGTFCGLLASAIPGVEAIATGNVASVLTAVPGLVVAIYEAYTGVSDRQKEILRSPLAYAALAQEKLR